MDKQESLKYVRSHCCGVVLEGQFHLLGGATKVPGERSDNVASDFHQVWLIDRMNSVDFLSGIFRAKNLRLEKFSGCTLLIDLLWPGTSLHVMFFGLLNGSFMSPCLVHIFLKCDFRCTRVLKVLQNGRWVFQWELKENLLFVTFFSDGYGPVADRQNHIDQQTLVNHGNPVRTQTRPSGSTHSWSKMITIWCICYAQIFGAGARNHKSV